MHVIGEWLICEDGGVRPTLAGVVRTPDGQIVDVPFLLDAGADRTVFSADFLDLLVPLQNTAADQIRLAGVGGSVSSITIEAAIGFIRDDRRVVTVRGQFAVFTEGESAELSVLGRDVTNNFGVIYDYPNRAVALLAPPHFYEIKRTS